MNRQSPDEDWQQTEKSQQVLNQKHHRTPRQWYRARTRKAKVSLVCGTLIALLLFCLFVAAVSVYGNRASTRSESPEGHAATQGPTSTLMPGLTPPPAQVFTPAPLATTKPSPSPTQGNGTQPNGISSSSPVYYGVHVALVDMSLVSTFEADAHKPVAIVMWYQQWGETDGYQYFQPACALQNTINGNFDAYIVQWAQASKAWGQPYFLRFAPEMNGNWNPWSEQVNGNKPGQFVLAWRHVHAIFTSQGVTNVTWVWSPNIDFSNSTPLAELYPGA